MKVEMRLVRLKTHHRLGAFGSDASQTTKRAISAFAKVSPDREKTNKKVI